MKSSSRALNTSFLMTFRFEKGSGDIYMVQELLGHRNISTTQKYLGVNYADAKAAVEAIAIIAESDRIPLLYNSITETDDHTLITELVRRGYNLPDLQEHKTTAEIVKFNTGA